MSKAEGKKISVKFTEKILTPNVDLSDYPNPSYPAFNADYYAAGIRETRPTFQTPESTKVGDLLLFVWFQPTNTDYGAPSGWTEIFNSQHQYTRLKVWYKFATQDGSESVPYTSYSNYDWCVFIAAIPYAEIPVVSTDLRVATRYPDPPELISGFESGIETLWIALCSIDDYEITGFPSNFPDNQIALMKYGGLGIATKLSTNSSENPEVFTAAGTDYSIAATMAIKLKSLETAENVKIAGAFKAGSSVTFQEPIYTEFPTEAIGPLVNKTLLPDAVGFHTTQDDTLELQFTTSHFKNVEGNITVDYDASAGNLTGIGGPVATFSQAFTPVDLIRKPNPKLSENISASITCIDIDLIPVTYKTGHSDDEYIAVSITDFSVVLTRIDDLDP